MDDVRIFIVYVHVLQAFPCISTGIYGVYRFCDETDRMIIS